MTLDSFEYAAGIGDRNGARAERRKQQGFSVRGAARQEMSRKARIDPIDSGGRLAPEPKREVANVQDNLTIDAGWTRRRVFGHVTLTKTCAATIGWPSIDLSARLGGRSLTPRMPLLVETSMITGAQRYDQALSPSVQEHE